ncbi:MAG: carboxypeptidase-like regulatory domain-containing protein [Terracidiphilus sp.]
MRLNRRSLAAGAAFALLAAGIVPLGPRAGESGFDLGPFAAQAQNLGERVVMGAVVDADSVPVAGATVFLKDLKSKNIRSYTTTDKGRFRFAQVYMAEDHELWAEKDGKKTAVKTVSSWDTRKEFEVELKLK